MGDVFKKDIINSQIKQCRQHGVEIINNSKYESFKEVIIILDKILSRFLKQDFIYIFTDPIIKNQSKYLLKAKPNKNDINKFLNIFKKLSKSRYALNLEENFFSKDYHQDIFFYVYSTRTKKVLAQGGGYHYQKNQKNINGVGFSYDVDSLAELI
jgi:ATP phosphoribosyltransferase regulatory subunit HisZ